MAALLLLALLTVCLIKLNQCVEERFANTLNTVSQKLGLTISVKDYRIKWGRVEIDNITVKEFDSIRIGKATIHINLNPVRGRIGQPKLLVIQNAAFQFKQNDLFENGQKIMAILFRDKKGNNDPQNPSLASIAGAFPQKLIVKNTSISLLDEVGAEAFKAEGLAMSVDRIQKKVNFKVGTLKRGLDILEKNLSGELNPGAKPQTCALSLKKSVKKGTYLWQINSIIPKDLLSLTASIEAKTLPPIAGEFIKNYFPAADIQFLKGSINLTRNITTKTIDFSTKLYNSKFSFNHFLLNSRVVGLMPISIEATGSWSPISKTLVLNNSGITTTLPSTEEVLGNRAVTFNATGTGRFQDGLSSPTTWHMFLTLPETSCQDALEAIEVLFTSSIEGFQLNGTVATTVELKLSTDNLRDLSYKIHSGHFGCHVASVPYSFSPELLNGPFTVRRTLNDNSDIEITLGSNSDSYTPIRETSGYVIDAFVAAEDGGFWKHAGIDFDAIETALKRNLGEGKVVMGGSTITMQTVKNLFLSHERTIGRKIEELFLAWYLESVLSKERILEIYLNIVEVGPRLFGITEASKHFFNKDPAELNVAESAYLASILPSPIKRYKNFCNRYVEPGLDRMMKSLIKRMYDWSYIGETAYFEAISKPLQFRSDTRYSTAECLERIARTE